MFMALLATVFYYWGHSPLTKHMGAEKTVTLVRTKVYIKGMFT